MDGRREEAIAWWYSLKSYQQSAIQLEAQKAGVKVLCHIACITGREIELIYNYDEQIK